MKKSLLVISVILLIAGLFISCNSEAAGTNSEVGYVKFGGAEDSKDLNYSITPEHHELVSDLYWYYKASPVNPGLFTQGTKNSWTEVKSGTGLNGTIGPFSKGTWSFEIVGSSSATAPSADTSFNGSTWTIAAADDDNIKYYGVSGSTYNVKTSVYIQGSSTAPTLIPVGLKYNSHATVNTFTLTLSNVTLLKSTTGDNPITVNDGYTVYYDVKNSSNSVVMSGSVVTADGAATITSASETVTSTSGTSATFTVSAYTDSARTNKVNYDSVTFVPSTGSTVTVSGELGHLTIETGYGQFADIDSTQYEAYVYNGTTYTGKETLTVALEDATEGQTVGLLRDINSVATGSSAYNITKSIILDGNGHTISASTDRVIDVNEGGSENLDVTITNLTVQSKGASWGPIYARTKIDSLTLNGVTMLFEATSGTQGLTFKSNENDDDCILTLNNCTIGSSTNPATYAIIVWSKCELNISDSTIYGWGNLYFKSNETLTSSGTIARADNVTFNFSTSSNGTMADPGSNGFGAFVFETSGSELYLSDCKVNMTVNGTCGMAAFLSNDWGALNVNNRIVIDGNCSFNSNGTKEAFLAYSLTGGNAFDIQVAESLTSSFTTVSGASFDNITRTGNKVKLGLTDNTSGATYGYGYSWTSEGAESGYRKLVIPSYVTGYYGVSHLDTVGNFAIPLQEYDAAITDALSKGYTVVSTLTDPMTISGKTWISYSSSDLSNDYPGISIPDVTKKIQ